MIPERKSIMESNTYLNRFKESAIEYSKFVEENDRVPKIGGDDTEYRLYNWAVAAVSQFRIGKLSNDRIDILKELCPVIYHRCTHNRNDFEAKLESFRDWTYKNLRYPRATGDEIEGQQNNWICNVRFKNSKGELQEEYVNMLDAYSPILLNSANPAHDFDLWILGEKLRERRTKKNVNIDQFGLNIDDLRYFANNDVLNLWDLYMRLCKCHETLDDITLCSTDNVSEEVKFMQRALNNKSQVNFIEKIATMIDPDLDRKTLNMLCEIFGFEKYKLGILVEPRFKLQNISNRLKKALWNYGEEDPKGLNILLRRIYCGETLEAIGNTYGVERESIRQLEAKALRSLRHPKYSNFIRGFEVKSASGYMDTNGYEKNLADKLPVRAQNALARCGVNTTLELYKFIRDNGESEIFRIRNIGEKTANTILDYYRSLDIESIEKCLSQIDNDQVLSVSMSEAVYEMVPNIPGYDTDVTRLNYLISDVMYNKEYGIS